MDDKIAAIGALGTIAQEMGPAFQPYFDASIKCLMNRVNYFDLSVQCESVRAMAPLLICLDKIHTSPKWTKGVVNVLNKSVTPYLSVCIPILISLISGEHDKELVSDAFSTLCTAIKTFGAGCIDSSLPRILELITTAIMKKLLCCTAHENEEDDDDEEMETKALIEMACDCLVEVCAVYGDKSMLFFPKIVPFLSVYTKKTEATFLRSLVIGTIGECCLNIGPASGSLTPVFLIKTYFFLSIYFF